MLSTQNVDVIEAMQNAAKDHVSSFIVDSELVAIDVETGIILDFQVLQTRQRSNIRQDSSCNITCPGKTFRWTVSKCESASTCSI